MFLWRQHAQSLASLLFLLFSFGSIGGLTGWGLLFLSLVRRNFFRQVWLLRVHELKYGRKTEVPNAICSFYPRVSLSAHNYTRMMEKHAGCTILPEHAIVGAE
jgi:hypothetical protein